MLEWICNNLGTIAVAFLVIAMLIGALIVVRKDKRKGKSSCGGSCEHCSMNCGGNHYQDLSK